MEFGFSYSDEDFVFMHSTCCWLFDKNIIFQKKKVQILLLNF